MTKSQQLLEKKRKKKNTKSKKTKTKGGGLAFGGLGDGADAGGGESYQPKTFKGTFLHELSALPRAFSHNVNATTQVGSKGTEQQEDQPQTDDDQQDVELDDQQADDQQHPDLQDDEQVEDEDPNRQGIIRTVDNAHLVYKRQTTDGDFEELWIYNIDSSVQDELEIRRAILAGTDIPKGKVRSEDGSQEYHLVTLGNAQLLHIIGLPN